ncbi:LysE family transporter [Polaribacter septentrionalilitoris]|uniref:LysE family transporter n=1 Tax=Polaribacter septentrionalilitoris TaxID=2494657 RepID=UPI00135B5F9A|nr:LysE family transporter [Polaribacter septentrionalilitoris]
MLSLFLFGFLFAFLGYTPPSVLNMTALKIRIDSNQKEFTKFSLGVSLIVFVQASLSIYLTNYVSKNPEFLALLEKLGVIVLLGLSIYFFKKNTKEKRQIKHKKETKNSFLTGLLLSTLNMFAIPFFSGVTAFLVGFNMMNFEVVSIFIFVIGSVTGAYVILYLYGKYAPKIQQKTGSFTQNINLILCYITAGFALFTFLKFVV